MVGNTLRRLTSKGLAHAVSPKAASLLRPIQFGVGVRSGPEGIIHATRTILEDDSIPSEEKWLVQVDLNNAHNNADRSTAFVEFRSHFPELSRWVESSYQTQSELLWGKEIITSSIGFQQGDSMAGLGEALILKPVTEKIQEEADLKGNFWIQDDGTPNHRVGRRSWSRLYPLSS